MSYLSVKQLHKSYGSHRIIDDLNLTIERGSFVSLLGPSGSGKTTILRCIAGLETPDVDAGAILLDGTTFSQGTTFLPPEKRGLGMVFQNYAVWPHLNVFENVAFPLRLRKDSKADLDRRVREVLALVKLTGLEHRFSHELSGGQQQRIALARALVGAPRLLLLDEPLSNLDALLRDELGAEIRRLQKALGLTTILVTHDQKEALSLSDRIVVLEQGKVAADGTPEDLYARPTNEFVASFLAGGQRLNLPSGESRLFLPRRWHVIPNEQHTSMPVRILTRIYLGSEYEYLAETTGIAEPIRFFARERYEMGDPLTLLYDEASVSR